MELGDDKYSLTDCKCCPRLSFDSNEHIYVQDRRGKWNFITDSLYKYFRLCLGKDRTRNQNLLVFQFMAQLWVGNYTIHRLV